MLVVSRHPQMHSLRRRNDPLDPQRVGSSNEHGYYWNGFSYNRGVCSTLGTLGRRSCPWPDTK